MTLKVISTASVSPCWTVLYVVGPEVLKSSNKYIVFTEREIKFAAQASVQP